MVAKLRIIFEIAKRFIKKLRVKDKRQQGQQCFAMKTKTIIKDNYDNKGQLENKSRLHH